jgi:hypothetical protein
LHGTSLNSNGSSQNLSTNNLPSALAFNAIDIPAAFLQTKPSTAQTLSLNPRQILDHSRDAPCSIDYLVQITHFPCTTKNSTYQSQFTEDRP